MAAISYLLSSAGLTVGGVTIASGPCPESVIPGTAAPGAAVATVTAASPVISAANEFSAGMPVVFSGSFASVTGLTVGTTYYVSATGLSATQFEVSATSGGSVITPGGSGSATPTVAAIGCIELRIDQTSLITDASVAGGLRPMRRGDVYAMVRILQEYLVVDPNVYQ
jgi:hypothetical protein